MHLIKISAYRLGKQARCSFSYSTLKMNYSKFYLFCTTYVSDKVKCKWVNVSSCSNKKMKIHTCSRLVSFSTTLLLLCLTWYIPSIQKNHHLQIHSLIYKNLICASTLNLFHVFSIIMIITIYSLVINTENVDES